MIVLTMIVLTGKSPTTGLAANRALAKPPSRPESMLGQQRSNGEAVQLHSSSGSRTLVREFHVLYHQAPLPNRLNEGIRRHSHRACAAATNALIC